MVKQNGLCGLADDKGKIIIPLDYLKIEYQLQDDTTVKWQTYGISDDTVFWKRK